MEQYRIPLPKKMKGAYFSMWKFLKKLISVLLVSVVVLFVVYFWNLDQKLLGWLYKQVNTMFDRKKVDLLF